MSVSPHLRGIVLAGALATLALALGLVTMAMNQSASKAAPHTIRTLKQRHLLGASTEVIAAHHVKAAPIDPNLVAALGGGLPRSIARALAAHSVVVVELTSTHDPVAQLASGEARAGAELAGASFVTVDVDHDGGDAPALTRLLGQLPVAPAALVYQRPATLYVTLRGFNDRTTVQQAAANAALTAGGTATRATTAAAPDWATSASALCKQAFGRIDALGGPANATRLATQKVQFETISASFLAQLKSLRPAPGQKAKAAELNTLLTKDFAATDAMVAAVSLHDAKAVAVAKARTAALAPRLNALEHQLGVTGCAELSA